MSWELRIAKRAQKALGGVPGKDRTRLLAALAAMQENPFAGDVVRLKGENRAWRRRVGSYRILFDVDTAKLTIDVVDVVRRTSTTY